MIFSDLNLHNKYPTGGISALKSVSTKEHTHKMSRQVGSPGLHKVPQICVCGHSERSLKFLSVGIHKVSRKVEYMVVQKHPANLGLWAFTRSL
jgi:hypothetical protein